MLLTQTVDKLGGLGLFGMVLRLREQLESSQYLSLSFNERLGLLSLARCSRVLETSEKRNFCVHCATSMPRRSVYATPAEWRSTPVFRMPNSAKRSLRPLA